MLLARKTVQVTSEAKASPIMTPLTILSAAMNIDHGDSAGRPGTRLCGEGVGSTSEESIACVESSEGADRTGVCRVKAV
jgi:hypothetical protein